MAATAASSLLLFYRGEGTDRHGRWLADILAWDDQRLELVPAARAQRLQPAG